MPVALGELLAGLFADEPVLVLLVVPVAAPDAGVVEVFGVVRGVGAASRVVPVPLAGGTGLVVSVASRPAVGSFGLVVLFRLALLSVDGVFEVPIDGVWFVCGVWFAEGVPILLAPGVLASVVPGV